MPCHECCPWVRVIRVGCSWRGLSCAAVPVLRLPGRDPAAPGVLHNTEFLFRASDWKTFKRLKNLMSLELSPCWNHSPGVTIQKKLFLYMSQNFPSVTKVKSSLSDWKSQVVEGTAAYWFLQLPMDNSPQARFCNISRIPHQPPRELTDPLKTENHCPRQSCAGSDIKTCNNEMTSKGRSKQTEGFVFFQHKAANRATKWQNYLSTILVQYMKPHNQYSPLVQITCVNPSFHHLHIKVQVMQQ